MRTGRLLLILSGLALLGGMIFCSVRYYWIASAPPVSIRITEVATNEVRYHVSKRGYTFYLELHLEETNLTRTLFWKANKFVYSGVEVEHPPIAIYHEVGEGGSYAIGMGEPLRADKAYRVVGSYFHQGAVERKIYLWASSHPVIYRLLPAPKTRPVTSEWFVVKPEASQTNKIENEK